jgi:3-methyladenine DNA glycosylase Tag
MSVDEQNWKMPEWWYREKRPPNDDAYFENMSRVIFQSGLNWRVIEDKWPTTKKAFENFEVSKVAHFSDAEVENLMKNPGIVRNKGKIKAIIHNAQNFEAIEKQYGSFQKYLESLDKVNNYANVIKELVNKFKWLGPPSATLFLYTVGENINP